MPRVELPAVGADYTNREKPLSAQRTKNLWPEINPEARSKAALHNTAGLKVFATLDGIDRGMHDFNNLMHAVNGTGLYSVDADGTSIKLGTIPGTDRCVLASDSSQLIIVTGSTPYRYTVAGGVEAITDTDLVNPTTVAYMNSQFIFDNNNGVFGEFVTSSIGTGLSIDALDFATAESHPDDIIAIVPFRQLMYFFGTDSVEPWQNTGTGNPPWARYNAGVQPYGIAGRDAIVSTSEFMYFLDHRRIPRRSNGQTYTNIGTPPIGIEFAKYTKIDDVIAFEFTQDNQQFIVFTFPTANRTWCFHEQTGSWIQLAYGVGNDRHRASSMIRMYGLNYCADHSNGLLYEYSLDVYTDNGNPIQRQRDTGIIHGGLFEVPGAKLFFNSVEFIIVAGYTDVAGTGSGPQPINSAYQYTACMPGFVLYKRDGNHNVSMSTGEASDGHILNYDAGWIETTPNAFDASQNGGWWGIKDIYDNLADPSVTITDYGTSDTTTLTACSLITWYGNPCCMCDDQIFSYGGTGGTHRNLLKSLFWVDGYKQIAPPTKWVLGACIQTVSGVDYFYVLTNSFTDSNPDPRTDGQDDVIYRKEVSATNGTSGWSVVGTVLYSDYGSTNDPIPYGTAYIDSQGVAFYTKFIMGASAPYDYAMMRVDLITGDNQIQESYLNNTGTFSFTESGTGSNIGIEGPETGYFTRDLSETRTGSMSGEVYLYTMGGQDARYDLYAKILHTDSYSYELNPQPTEAIGAGQYVSKADPTKSVNLDSTTNLVIKKNGSVLREVLLSETSTSFNSSGTVRFDTSNPDPYEAFPVYTYTSNYSTNPTTTQRSYIFLHPNTPDEDVYIEKVIEWEFDPAKLSTSCTLDMTLGVYRGQGASRETLQQITQSATPQNPNLWYDQGTAIQNLPQPVYNVTSHSDSGSGDLSGAVDGWVQFGYRPQLRIAFETLVWGSGGTTDYSLANGDLCLSGGIGFNDFNYGDPSHGKGIMSYQHAMFRDPWTYKPEFAVASRTITEDGDRSYIFATQDVFKNANFLPATVAAWIDVGYMQEPQKLLYSAISHNDVTADPTSFTPFYTINHSGENWTSGHAYTANDTVFNGRYIYECILSHTASSADEPDTGANWATYWKYKDLDISLRSNVLTQTEIETLTGMTSNDLIPELGIINIPVIPETLPAPSPDPQIEIASPFWLNTGNWINLSALTNTTFASMFGDVIEGANFDKVVAVNKAASVNTSDAGNRIQITDSIDCSNAALYITDTSGNVVDSMIYSNVASGDSVLVPPDSNYYVVVTSDTGNAKIRKWDSTPVITTGSTAWETFFGVPFTAPYITKTALIPSGGISLRFTVPNTADSVRVSFTTIENNYISTTRTGSVNQTVGDYTSDPTFTWGIGGGIHGGINFAGQDIDLIPGETYFFNVRNDSPTAQNYITIQASYVVQ